MAVMAFTLAALAAGYTDMLDTLVVRPQWKSAIDRAAQHVVRHRARYEQVQEQTGVPWYWIGAVHWREASGNWHGVLHNGERIIGTGRKTRLRPAGKGPFATWEEAAVHALQFKGLDRVSEWTPEAECYYAEDFNGWGYRQRGAVSAYVWSGSSHYSRGKFVRDGPTGWSPGTVDQQVGVVPVIARVKELVGHDEPELAAPETADAPIPPSSFHSSSKFQLARRVKRGLEGLTAAVSGLMTYDNAILALETLVVMGVAGGAIYLLMHFFQTKQREDYQQGRYIPRQAEGRAE
jgi:lysozyme family protein